MIDFDNMMPQFGPPSRFGPDARKDLDATDVGPSPAIVAAQRADVDLAMRYLDEAHRSLARTRGEPDGHVAAMYDIGAAKSYIAAARTALERVLPY